MRAMALYTRETVIAYAPAYFAHIEQRRPGTQRRVVGKVRPNHVESCSYFVVKRSHREEKWGKMMQHGVMCSGHYWRVSAVDFVLASLHWGSTQPVEHAVFFTRKEADKALCTRCGTQKPDDGLL